MLSNALLEEILQKASGFVEDKGGAVVLIQPHPYNNRAGYFVVDGEQAGGESGRDESLFVVEFSTATVARGTCWRTIHLRAWRCRGWPAQRPQLETYLMAAVEKFDLECGYHRFQATVPPGAGEQRTPQHSRYGGKPTVPSPHEYRTRQLPTTAISKSNPNTWLTSSETNSDPLYVF